jgi:hypothetical protein
MVDLKILAQPNNNVKSITVFSNKPSETSLFGNILNFKSSIFNWVALKGIFNWGALKGMKAWESIHKVNETQVYVEGNNYHMRKANTRCKQLTSFLDGTKIILIICFVPLWNALDSYILYPAEQLRT